MKWSLAFLTAVVCTCACIIRTANAASGSIRTIGLDDVSWCWTSTGYDDYRTCSETLLDSNRVTFMDLSSMSTENLPSWFTLTFFTFTDVDGIDIVFTGDNDLTFNFVFSDGSYEQAEDDRQVSSMGGREFTTAQVSFPRRITRSLTVQVISNKRYMALIHDLVIYGSAHRNLERISDWEHNAKCKYYGRDCDVLINGFVDKDLKMGFGRSAILYLNSTYPITHLTLLEAVPESGESLYEQMAVTFGNPTGIGFHTETYEFSLCKQEWSNIGPAWTHITFPKPIQARYINITILGEAKKVVNGLSEVEVFRSRDGSGYRQQDQACVALKEVEEGGCSCHCENDSPHDPRQNVARGDEAPAAGEQAAFTAGMSAQSKLLFALCGTAGLAVGCAVCWMVTCVLLCRERRVRAPHSSLHSKDSQKSLTRWEERDSRSSSENSTPTNTMKRLREEAYVAPGTCQVTEERHTSTS